MRAGEGFQFSGSLAENTYELQTNGHNRYHFRINYNRMIWEGKTMTIYPVCTSLMRYRLFVNCMERYYRYKMKQPCFLIMQNSRWTVVTLEM